MSTFTGDRTGHAYDTGGGRVLGAGGCATVTSTADGRSAVKVLNDPLPEPLVVSCRLQFLSAAALEPHVAVVVETCGDRAFVMRPVGGRTLEDWMAVWFQKDARGGTPDLPPVELLAAVGERLAGAVAALERLGWRACDLKPANVMLDLAGDALGGLVLVDPDSVVAAARVRLGDGSTAVPEPAADGTPDFLRPERLAAGPALPFADDDGRWALAVCLYRLGYLGRHPAASTDPRTAGRSFDELMADGYCPRWTDPARCPKGPVTYAVDPRLERAFLARRPQGRPSPAQFEAALAAWRKDLAPGPKPVGPAVRVGRAARRAARRTATAAARHMSLSAATAFVLVALAAVGWSERAAVERYAGTVFGRPLSPPPPPPPLPPPSRGR